MQDRTRPTLRKIAQVCGCSVCTVSLALNNHPRIPDRTKKRILSRARQLGWSPNPLASIYMAHRRSTQAVHFQAVLGFLVDCPVHRGVEDLPEHLQETYRAFEERAARFGFRSELFTLHDRSLTAARFDRLLYSRGVPGFALTNLNRESRETLRGIQWQRYSAVAVGSVWNDAPLHRVASDVAPGFRELIEAAQAAGYKRIAVAVSGDYDRKVHHGVLYPLEYMRARLEEGQRLDVLVFEGEEEAAIPRVAAWLRRLRPELAVGNGVYEAARSLGWRIPEDIAFATFHHSRIWPDHAGIDHRMGDSGTVAAEVLVREVTHNERGVPGVPVDHHIACRYVPGPTMPGCGGRRAVDQRGSSGNSAIRRRQQP